MVIGGGVESNVAHIGKASVLLPPDAILCENGITLFAIDVLPADGSASWRVRRRYNHFRALADSLRGIHADPPFPRKHLFSCNHGSEKLETRRKGLELWLNNVLTQMQPPGDYLRRFLLIGRFPIPVSPSATTLPEPSAPPAPMEERELVNLIITIPQGVVGDDLLNVKVPDFGEVTISVPWGLQPGAALEVWFDPANGTLGMHPPQH